jgi:hypothetical protein
MLISSHQGDHWPEGRAWKIATVECLDGKQERIFRDPCHVNSNPIAALGGDLFL